MDSSSCQAVTQPTMYCRKCWYILDGLDDPRCPECGRAFDPANRRTYRTRPRRQWWSRVLLRVMVVMMLVVAIPAGFLYRRYRIEHRAMAALQTRGFRYRTAPYGPEWLTKWATQRGLPMVEVVVSVPEMFHSDTISSDLYHPVPAGPAMRYKDADLSHLRGLTDLRELEIGGREVTNQGLEYLEDLTKLTKLYVLNTQATDDGLRHLQRLTRLRSLCLYRNAVTDEGLEHLRGMTQLEYLYLDDIQLTDRGLPHLARFAKLKVLSIGGADVTDEGLMQLKGLRKLERLYLYGTRVTYDGGARFNAARPNLEVRGP